MILVVQVIDTKEKSVRNFYRCTCSYAISVIVFSCNICLALKMYLERSPVINKNPILLDESSSKLIQNISMDFWSRLHVSHLGNSSRLPTSHDH